jgi:Flp pilus assembly protein TadG
MKNGFKAYAYSYLKETKAATAIAFALIIPVVVGSAGMAVDLSMAYMVKQRLSHAIDAAALAAAASTTDNADVSAKVDQFFNQNYPPEKIGATYDLTVSVSGDDIHVSAKADYNTTFARLLGIDSLTVAEDATVTREILGLEVAMVLDVTGSMSTNNNIATLRTAATNFLNILCNGTTCSSGIKIGIVPFATAVNVGPYGLGKKPNGTTYDTAFVNNPYNTTFNQGSSTRWWGCVEDGPHPNDTLDSDSTWRWDMYRWTYSGAQNSKDRTKTAAINNLCNKAYILPLTSTKTDISSKISSLTASGNTLSNLGMVWGYRILSPEAPFREGSAWDDHTVRKAAILMTDGDNNVGNVYSGEGPWLEQQLTDHDLDERLLETCENMKADGITVYTVTFTSGISAATKEYFRSCATDESKYIDAPTQDDLVAAFEQISRELANIHLKE